LNLWRNKEYLEHGVNKTHGYFNRGFFVSYEYLLLGVVESDPNGYP